MAASEVRITNFRKAAVLGAGVMGAQIAAHLANAGVQVLLLDLADKKSYPNAAVDKALGRMLKMKPSPIVHSGVRHLITTGNFDDDLEKLKEADWIIEAVIEKLDVKQQLMGKVEKVASPKAVISTNTSGLPVHQIASKCSAGFRKRFLGTHFFNPPRYLKLLELIPTPETSDAVIEKVERFGRIQLGKGIVLAKDTPNFIANRVGTYAMMLSIKALEDDYTIEEIDALTGPLTGRPKSATFRTADVVGLDTLSYVSQNLWEAVTNDPDRDVFKIPSVLENLVGKGHTGSKTGKGFYVKEKGEIKSLNPETMEYEPRKRLNLGDLDQIKKNNSLRKRWKLLFEEDSRAGSFIRQQTTRSIAYAMNRIPEISDIPLDIDRAIEWGFGWKMGPFAICDAIGAEAFIGQAEKMEIKTPEWFNEMLKSGASSFYKLEDDGSFSHYVPGKGYETAHTHADEISVASLKTSDGRNEIWNNKEAALLDSGDGILIYEFRSKANTLGFNVINGILEAIKITERGDYRGMVIANDGDNFSVGANLGELAYTAEKGDFDKIEQAVANFQKAALAIRYAEKPVVVATQGKVLGGGCELAMGAAGVVAATETYMGLVELGAGLIPAGSGTMTLAARAGEAAANQHASQIQPFLQKAFETVAMAKVAISGQEAVDMGYLSPERTIIAMNADRRIYMARELVLRLSNFGYMAPPPRTNIFVAGSPGLAVLKNAAWQMQQAGWISAYDAFLAGKLAYVLCGGDLSGPSRVHEDYLIELEREVFLSLLGEEKTKARIHSILTTNKPLRN